MLEESIKKFRLTREINELKHWINDKEVLASAEELGKDLEHVELLLMKFEDFEKDISANEVRLESINDMAQDLVEEGHSDADEIQRLCEVGVLMSYKSHVTTGCHGFVIKLCYYCYHRN